jgi:hypothetical protein
MVAWSAIRPSPRYFPDIAAETLDRFSHCADVFRFDFTPFLWIEPRGNRGRADQVAKQDRQVPALAYLLSRVGELCQRLGQQPSHQLKRRTLRRISQPRRLLRRIEDNRGEVEFRTQCRTSRLMNSRSRSLSNAWELLGAKSCRLASSGVNQPDQSVVNILNPGLL